MGTETIKVNAKDFKQLVENVELIKDFLFCHKSYPDPEGELTEKMKEDLEFARRTEEAWKEIDEGKFTEYSTEEYLQKLKNGG